MLSLSGRFGCFYIQGQMQVEELGRVRRKWRAGVWPWTAFYIVYIAANFGLTHFSGSVIVLRVYLVFVVNQY